jgi:hypothetical protein
MSDMATWVSSFIIPIGVSIATVIITNLTVGPRLAARGKRIQENHSARDQFQESLLDLAALRANLRGVDIPDTWRNLSGPASRLSANGGKLRSGPHHLAHRPLAALGYVGPVEFSNLIMRYSADAEASGYRPGHLKTASICSKTSMA